MFFLIIFAFVSIIIGNYFVLFYAPIEATLGLPQKIFYFHVSFAWWGLFAFFFVFLFSLLYLLKKDLSFFLKARVLAEIGVLYSTIVLVTGITWAKASWNTYWTWDPKLITTFIMWFMYVLYLVFLNFEIEDEKKFIFCSVLAIVSFIDVPIVFLAAKMFRSIHPVIFMSKEGGMPFEMLLTMFVNIFCYGCLFFLLFYTRYSQLLLKDKIRLIRNKKL